MVDINKPPSGAKSGAQNKQNDVEEVTMDSTTSELLQRFYSPSTLLGLVVSYH